MPITLIETTRFAKWRDSQPAALRGWIASTGFTAAADSVSLVAGPDGGLGRVLAGMASDNGASGGEFAALGGLAGRLPPGRYRLDGRRAGASAEQAALGWALGCYRFDRYKRADTARRPPRLAWPLGCDRAAVLRQAAATFLVRDLINTPAGDLGPAALAAAARAVARRHKARISVITGPALLARNYPLIHAVGRASDEAPRLIDLRWGRRDAPRLTIVGKGVCFDSGGLDLKTSGGMLRMKKDMGGAAHALGLADMVMGAGLKLRLRVLVPAVENSVAGNALHPLDVVASRKGLTVEIGNTDAEGRLILSDALAEAAGETPALLIDFATLTGAARVALGNDLPALFSNDDSLAAELLRAGAETQDPMWRLPLWQPYRSMLDSKVADINNVSEGGTAGAITAALYLQEFVNPSVPWAHLDLMGWNVAARPGRPVGGEAQGMRAAFAVIARRFGGARR